MKKQQIILLSGGVLLLVVLFVFGKTVPPKSAISEVKAPVANNASSGI